jgi:CubicO group peptidase (beta-lactamase class C family)
MLVGLAVIGAVIGLGTGCRDGYAGAPEPESSPNERARYVDTRELVTRLAEDLLQVHAVTGVSLALVDGRELVWATGFGLADVERRLPAGPRTVYNVGSLTKPVTAAAVMQAIERGELSLDQTLAELLPELELGDQAEQRITLAQLLSHQSGLPSDWFVHDLSADPPPWTEIVAEIRGLELAAEPGSRTLYSNLGLTLAGAALARASGRPFEDQVSEALLRPAGMRTAYFPGGPPPEPVRLPIAGGPRGHDAVEHAAAYREHQLESDPQLRLHPAGGLRASVLDLAAFASLMLAEGRVGNQPVLAPSSVDALLRAHNDELEADLDHRFGYAWLLDHERLDWLGRVAWHGGRTYYHHALVILLPDHDLAVVVASNSLGAGPVVERLAVETLIAAVQEKHGLEAPIPAPAPSHCAAPEDRVLSFCEAHAGDYVTSTGLVTIGPSEGTGGILEIVSQTLLGSSRLTLDRDDGGTVEGLAGTRVRFVERAGAHRMVIERDGVARPAGVRLGPPPPIPAAWLARLGPWQIAERPGEVSIIAEPELEQVGGRLRLRCLGLLEHPPLPIVMVLEPIDDRRARIAGHGRGQGTILEVRGEGSDERLWWSGRELRRSP